MATTYTERDARDWQRALTEKEAQVKALADALVSLFGAASGRIPEAVWTDLKAETLAALRLAGRLP